MEIIMEQYRSWISAESRKKRGTSFFKLFIDLISSVLTGLMIKL